MGRRALMPLVGVAVIAAVKGRVAMVRIFEALFIMAPTPVCRTRAAKDMSLAGVSAIPILGAIAPAALVIGVATTVTGVAEECCIAGTAARAKGVCRRALSANGDVAAVDWGVEMASAAC